MLDVPATTSSHPRGWRGSRDTMRAPMRAQPMVARVTMGQPCSVHTLADRRGARIAVKTVSRTAQIVASTASDHATRVLVTSFSSPLRRYRCRDRRALTECRLEVDNPAYRANAVLHVGQPGAARGTSGGEAIAVVGDPQL